MATGVQITLIICITLVVITLFSGRKAVRDMETTSNVIAEAHEANLLKRLLKQRLESYTGITYSELVDICTMIGIQKDGDANESV